MLPTTSTSVNDTQLTNLTTK